MKKKLFLIDGNSLIYRSYYAIRNLSNSKGFPTNAIFGFVSMINKIIKEHKPDYIAVAFDVSKKTFRNEIYDQYKAQRPPMPDDLRKQLPLIKEFLKAYKIPILELENYEADDVIGTFSNLAKQKGLDVIIITGDKDFYQLVDDSIFIYNPSKEELFDREKVKEYIGVYPEQIVDLLSLQGDNVDNIPGIPGVGPKTAVSLLNEYGSIDELLKNIDNLKKKSLKEKIKNNLDKLEISRKLTPIVTNLPLSLKLEDFKFEKPDENMLLKLYKELEFKSLIKDIENSGKKLNQNYVLIKEKEEIINLVDKLKKEKNFVFDTETDNTNPVKARLVGISFAYKEGEAFYIPILNQIEKINYTLDDIINILKDVFEDEDIEKTGHNLKYDIIVLRKYGIDVKGVRWDTMILSYLIEPNRRSHKIDDLSLDYLNYKMVSYKEIAGSGKSERPLTFVPLKELSFYSCEDADISLRLKNILVKKVEEENLIELYKKIELPLIKVLVHLEENGIKVDPIKLKQLSNYLSEEIEKLKSEIFSMAGERFNINSTQQLGRILFEKLKLPVIKKTKKSRAYSTSFEVLEELRKVHPIIENILTYRTLSKLKSGYVDSLPNLIYTKTGRIHTSYNQTVAATGRLSSSDPNLQNIPIKSNIGKKIREAFIPEKGHLFLSADYSQVELRVLAHLSQDPVLIEAFNNGEDIHSHTANEVFGDLNIPFEEKRRRAKIINFSIIYGKTAFSLAKELGIERSTAQKFIDMYFERYKRVKEFIKESIEEAEKFGFVQTIFGRKRPIPEIHSSNTNIRNHGERMAINTKVQGSAADIMKKAMIDVFNIIKANKFQTKIILQVHDELVFEVPESEKERIEMLIKDSMENCVKLIVPLVVDIKWGKNWAEA